MTKKNFVEIGQERWRAEKNKNDPLPSTTILCVVSVYERKLIERKK